MAGTFPFPVIGFDQRNIPLQAYAPTASAQLGPNQLMLLLDASAASGKVTLTLPPAHTLAPGTIAAYYVSESSQDFGISSHAADPVAVSQSDLTALANYCILVNCGIGWVVLAEVST